MTNNMFKLFKEGDRISGYCGGCFGRDDYRDKVCVEVKLNYAVFEHNNCEASVLNHSECDNLTREEVEEWIKEYEYAHEEDGEDEDG